MLATDGDFFQFDYLRNSLSKFKEDYNTDDDKKYKIPGYLKSIEEMSKLDIPIILLFVPRTLDDNGTIYKNKYITKMEKEIIDLKEEIKKLNEKVDKINETLEKKEEKKECDVKMLNQKRERSDKKE